VCAVSLQFKILCRGNIDGFTDGYTDRMIPVGILPRVEKNLRNCAKITDDNTDGLVPVGISQRVEKHLRSVSQSLTS
jgi:hypothetical protein